MKSPRQLEKIFKKDFTVFAETIFQTTLQLGPLTAVQRDICKLLQHNENPRLFLSCFRNAGKSVILSLFAIWKLYLNPDEKILVISATSPRSKDFVRFCKDVIDKTPLLQGLAELRGSKNRNSAFAFDIVGAKPSQFASLKAIGITGQITGSRATIVIFDDVEINSNSQTEASRIKLSEAVKESNALILPGGFIYIIGTPQSRFSIYNDLTGFETIKYPIYYPNYNYEFLAPYLEAKRQANPDLIGTITDTDRFTPKDIEARKLAYGESLFQLQYMLDTTLSDNDRFPLRVSDLRVIATMPDRYFIEYQDFGAESYRNNEFVQLQPTDQHTLEYSTKIIAVDPCGRGQDELAAIVLATGGGRVFILDSYYNKSGGYDDEAMNGVLALAKKHKVKTIVAEQNYGGGMYNRLLIKHIKENNANLGIVVEAIFSRGTKANRIIASVEPFLNSGKLVADVGWFRQELENPQFNLFQQMGTIECGHIYSKHDDRIDALSIGLDFLSNNLAISEKIEKADYEEALFNQELESIIHSPTWVKTGRTKYDKGNSFGNALDR